MNVQKPFTMNQISARIKIHRRKTHDCSESGNVCGMSTCTAPQKTSDYSSGKKTSMLKPVYVPNSSLSPLKHKLRFSAFFYREWSHVTEVCWGKYRQK
jgi:hypothetical protein